MSFGMGGLIFSFSWWTGSVYVQCVPLLMGVGDCSTLVLLFHPGLFSALFSPLELILLSLI